MHRVGCPHRRGGLSPAQGSTGVLGLRLDGRIRIRWAEAIFGCLTFLIVHGSSSAQSTQLPSNADQKKITDWLEACNLNKDLTSVTCAEIEHCVGKVPIKKNEDPLIYEFMRDPDRDGTVCEHWEDEETPAPSAKGDVVFGLGIATGIRDRNLGPLTALDSGGDPVSADVRGGETRPVFTAAYLFPRPKDDARVRPGLMALLDADFVADDGLVRPRGIGVGVTVAFRGTLGDNWTQAFGVGVAYLWESAKLLSDDPNPVLEDRTVDSVLLVINYSFGKRWWQQ